MGHPVVFIQLQKLKEEGCNLHMNITVLFLASSNIYNSLLFTGKNNYNIQNSIFKNSFSYFLFQPNLFHITKTRFERFLNPIVYKEEENCPSSYPVRSPSRMTQCSFTQISSQIILIYNYNTGGNLEVISCMFSECKCDGNMIYFYRNNFDFSQNCIFQCSSSGSILYFEMGVTEDCFGSLMFNSNTILQYPNQSINNNKVITSRQGQTKISYSNFTYNRKVSDDIYLIDVNADHSRGKSFELTYSNFMHNYGELMIEVSDHSRAWLMYCNFVNNTGPENSNLFYFQYVDSKAVDLQFLYFDKNIYPIFRNTLFTSQSLLKGCNFDIEEDEMYSPNSNKMQCINCTFGLETVPTCTLTIEAMASCVVPGTPLPPTPEETTEELMSSSQEATEETSIQTSSEEAISSSQKTVEETSFIITEITEETIISSQATAEETSPIITEITTETTEETIISSQATAEETSFIITEITTETTEETYTRTSEYVSDVSYASSSSQHSSGLNTFIIIIVVLIIMVIVIIIIVCFVKRDKQKDKNPNSFIENDLLKSDPSLFSAENSSELLSANSLDNPYALYETTPSRDGLDVDL